MKIDNDKYYTPIELSNELILKTYEVLVSENITEINYLNQMVGLKRVVKTGIKKF